MIISVEIKEKRASTQGAPTIVCGNSTYRVKFTFDDEWEGSLFKTARFVYVQSGTVKHTDVVFEGDTVDVPAMANTSEVLVGVFAGDLRTTTPARIPCEASIRCGTGAPAEPTPDVYDQIMELLNQGGGGGTGAGLPGVTDEDEGKVLTVVGGKWEPAPVTIPYSETTNTAGGTTVNIG